MERPVGSIFEIRGQKVQVVKQTSVCDCFGCCFELNGLCFKDEEAGECDFINRIDRTEVIFKKV